MSRTLTLALVQIDIKIGDLAANLHHVLTLTADVASQGGQFVVFPELALTGYHQELLGSKLIELALTPEDEPIQRLAKAAKDFHVHLVVGFIERRTIPGVVYNSIVTCDPNGQVLGTYAKSHLFATEKLHFRPGASLEVYATEGKLVGPMICMDIGYPEVARIICLQGAEFLFAPSAWIREDEDLWPLHLRARALDNLVFVAGINRVGVEDNLHFIGQSMVVNPRGHVIGQLGEAEDCLITTIDLDDVALARRKAMQWTGRRPELYGQVADLLRN